MEFGVVFSKAVGIDLGLKHFAILSTGEVIPNPKHHRKYEKQLIRWQRILSRRRKGSQNRNKARLKVARLYEKIRNGRQDFPHSFRLGSSVKIKRYAWKTCKCGIW
ncbi:hypothetical protein GCM10011571_00780 [Marinithermofilum abyssi]|uniref:Probable transposase IS891/IS1136/IS1341 domain-containing protein n=1 Tax=Marinithermofilum abyssi TaxID=1571185 RepID=A0A8J2VFR5_9BACL|nr:hypothetical protein GCM10011571_00780 [Marinithermofilum abyssi]